MLNPTQLSALSRMFSSSVISEIAKKGQSPLFSRLLSEASVFEFDDADNVTIGDAFDTAFSLLRRSGLRNEYVYRSALIRNVLLGRHSLRTASMLTEFRIGSSKSDRDSLARLESQLENYRKAFSKIYVIAGTAHIQDILEKTSEDVGVMSLVRWNRISIVREAKENTDYICTATIFDSLRLSEAIDILNELNIDIPDLPNTLMRNAIRGIFTKLNPIDVQSCMIKTLKRTRNLAPLSTLIANLPSALQSIALMVQLRSKDRDRLVETLNKPLNEAFKWV
ncbi:MAG: sce7726 family protein [Klebsiella aerogenes]